MAHVCYDDITHLFGLPLVRAPEDYEMNFSYLADTPLFFFELVEKLNRGYSMDRRICFLTDYTLNIANENGKVSRCCKVEDIRELIVDERKHAVGVRMRDEPFALGTPKQGGIFYDMPVDLYLRCSNAEMLKRLLRPLSVIFRHQTQDVLPVRPLREKESLDELLVVAPNGRRIKYPPMQYHNKRDVERAQRRDADDVFDRSSPRQYAQPCEEGGGPVYSRSRSGWRSEPRSVRNEEVVVTRQSCLKSPNAEEQRGGRQSSPRESGSRGGRGEHDDSEVHHLRRRLADQDRLIGRLQRENSAKQHDLDEMHSRSQQPTQGRTSEGKSVSSANNRQRGKRDSATAARRSDSARRSGSKNRKTSKQHPRSGSPRSHSHRAKSRSARNTKSPSARPRVTEVNEGRIYREEPPHSPPPQQQQQQQQQAKLQVLQDQIDTQSRQIEALQQQLYVEVSGRQEMEVRVLRHYRDLPLPLRQDITEAKLAHQLARKRAGESYWRDQDEQRERELHDLLYSLQQAQFAKEKEEQQRRANESHYTRNNTSSAPYNGINASNNYNRQATTYTQRGGSQDVTELQRQLRALQDEVMGLRERLRAATFRY